MRNRYWAGVGAALLAFANQVPAYAGMTTFNFSGEVLVFEPGNVNQTDGISAGSSFTASYTFDTAQGPGGTYSFSDFSFVIEGHVFNLDAGVGPTPSITVVNDDPFDGDIYTLVGGITYDGKELEFELLLDDFDGTAFSSDALPVTPLDLAPFEQRTLTIFSQSEDPLFLLGEVNDFSGNIAPSPDAAALGMVGLATAYALRRRFG